MKRFYIFTALAVFFGLLSAHEHDKEIDITKPKGWF